MRSSSLAFRDVPRYDCAATGPTPKQIVSSLGSSSPSAHLVYGESRVKARIHEFRHRVRKGIDHDCLAGGLIFDVCLRAVELAIRVQFREIERASVPQHPTRLPEGRAEGLHMLQLQGGDDGVESGA